MQTLLAGLIVAVAAVLLGVRVWRSCRAAPSCSCVTGEAAGCCHGCDGCERLRSFAAYTADAPRAHLGETPKRKA